MKRINTMIIFAVLIFSSVSFATDAPIWTGHYVNDYAHVLDNTVQLESMLTELEKNNTVEFAVVTISSLPPDEDMNSYAYKIFNSWGIGKKESDNGLLFLMIENGTPGSRMKIEVGYGLEGYITDSAAGRMLDDALPYYDSGDYSHAAYDVVSEAVQKLEANYVPRQQDSSSAFNEALSVLLLLLPLAVPLIFLVVIAAILSNRCPRCGSLKVKCIKENCICQNCGFKFRRRKKARIYPFVVGGGWGGGGFGGGGFGGGSSGGGGAGR